MTPHRGFASLHRSYALREDLPSENLFKRSSR